MTAGEMFRDRVRAEMDRRNLKAVDLAAAIGYSQPWASAFLRRRRAVTMNTADRISAYLGVPVWRLFTEESEAVPLTPEESACLKHWRLLSDAERRWLTDTLALIKGAPIQRSQFQAWDGVERRKAAGGGAG
jgi:transcriptional regulator with XRE-family HTH domain